MNVRQLRKRLAPLHVRAEEEGVLSADDKQAYHDKLLRFGERISKRVGVPFREDFTNVPDATELKWIEERILDQLIIWLERHGVSCVPA